MRKRNCILYLVVLTAVAACYLLFQTFGLAVLLIFLVLCPLLSVLLVRMVWQNMRVDIKVPEFMMWQKELPVVITIYNRARFPVDFARLQIVISNHLSGNSQKAVIPFGVKPRHWVNIPLSMGLICPGTFEIVVGKVELTDILGLLSFPCCKNVQNVTTLYPKTQQQDIAMEMVQVMASDSSRYAKNRAGNDVSEIFALRDYIRGDDVRRIHWKLSSKRDQLMIREFSQPVLTSVTLLIELVRGEEAVLKRIIEALFFLAEGLIRSGIAFNVGWYDEGLQKFYLEDVQSKDEWEQLSYKMLLAYGCEELSAAMDFYLQDLSQQKTLLIYFTGYPSEEKIEAASIGHTVVLVHDIKDLELLSNELELR